MKSDFNENTYETCFNANFINRYLAYINTPDVPSRREEGQEGGGYDVHHKLQRGDFSQSFFFQFKVPHFVQRRMQNRNHELHDFFGGQFYWFYLKTPPESDQHNLLHKLATQNENVYYVAPIFHKEADINILLSKMKIIDFSRYFPVEEMCEFPGPEKHKIAYDYEGQRACYKSNITELEFYREASEFATEIENRSINIEYIETLKEKLMKIVKEHWGWEKFPDIPKKALNKDGDQDLLIINYVLQRFYNAKLILWEGGNDSDE